MFSHLESILLLTNSTPPSSFTLQEFFFPSLIFVSNGSLRASCRKKRDMTSNRKRNIDTIDLTGDDEDHYEFGRFSKKPVKANPSGFLHGQRSSQSSRERRNEDSFSFPSQSSAIPNSSQTAPSFSQDQDLMISSSQPPQNTQAIMEEETHASDLVLGSQDFDDGDYDNYELYGIY